MASQTPERDFHPSLQRKISPFQKCSLIKVLRPDRLETAMQQFVNEAFGG